MKRLKHILITLFCCALVLPSLSCCNKDDAIPKKDMANILVDMYLADFYIERHDMHTSTDTLLVYDGVLAKYGYTYEQYETSRRKYITKDDEYIRIHKLAQDIVRKRKALAIKRAQEASETPDSFWLLDSTMKYSSRELVGRLQYRSFRWIAKVKPNDTIVPGLGVFADTALSDFPSGIEWWKRNMNPAIDTICLQSYSIK